MPIRQLYDFVKMMFEVRRTVSESCAAAALLMRSAFRDRNETSPQRDIQYCRSVKRKEDQVDEIRTEVETSISSRL